MYFTLFDNVCLCSLIFFVISENTINFCIGSLPYIHAFLTNSFQFRFRTLIHCNFIWCFGRKAFFNVLSIKDVRSQGGGRFVQCGQGRGSIFCSFVRTYFMDGSLTHGFVPVPSLWGDQGMCPPNKNLCPLFWETLN